MTYDDLAPAQQDALRWLVRVTLWYGHGHLDPTLDRATYAALLRLCVEGLADVELGGTVAATPSAFALWQTRRPRPVWKDAAA